MRKYFYPGTIVESFFISDIFKNLHGNREQNKYDSASRYPHLPY